MQRRLAAVGVALVCSVTLWSCSNDSEAAGPTPSASSKPTHTITSPHRTTATTMHPVPPEMPALAKQRSKAGAKAFVDFYVTLINYSWKRGHGKLLTSYGTNACNACHSLANTIGKFNKSGGYQHGAEWTVKTLFLVPTEPLIRPVIVAAIHVDRGRWRKSRTAPVNKVVPRLIHHTFRLAWKPGGYRLAELATS